MGLFTGLAIGALAAVNVIQGVKAKKAANANKAALAPAPIAPLTPPTPPVVDPSGNEVAAQAAGQRQRKRAAAGSVLTRPQMPAAGAAPMAARPKSLIGY